MMTSCIISKPHIYLGLSNSTTRLFGSGIKNDMRRAWSKYFGIRPNPSTTTTTTNPACNLNFIRSVHVSTKHYISFVYSVSLKTGDIIGAGTDSDVFIRMIGMSGSTDEIMLKTEAEHMERGRLDHYTVPSDDVGQLKKIIIRHNNTGFAPGWFLEWVKIRDGRGKKYHFDCNAWLAKGDTTDNIKLLKERNYQMDSNANSIVAAAIEVAALEVDDSNAASIRSQQAISTNTDKVEKLVVLEGGNIEVVLEEENISMDDLAKSDEIDKEIFKDLKVLEELAEQLNSPKTETKSALDGIIKDDKNVVEKKQHGGDSKHLTNIQNLTHSALGTAFKGDVLSDMLKDNMTRKKFTVKVEDSSSKGVVVSTDKSKPSTLSRKESSSLSTFGRNESSSLPHLYMSTTCGVNRLDSFVDKIDQKLYRDTRNSVLTTILCHALIDASVVTDKEDFNVFVMHNGNAMVLQDCRFATVEDMCKQFRHFKDPDDTLTMPRYGLNIVDHFNVTQLSSVLRMGEIVALNVNGPKLDIDASGHVCEYLTLAVSCDHRVVTEETCALLLLNFKKYISNPSLLAL